MLVAAPELPDPEDDTLDDETRIELGIDQRAPEAIGDPVDPREEFVPGEAVAGDEEVTETSEGIAFYRHPDVMVTLDPDLWGLWHEWCAVGPHAVSSDDYHRRSARWVDGWSTLYEAHARLMRRIKDDADAARKRKGEDGDEG